MTFIWIIVNYRRQWILKYLLLRGSRLFQPEKTTFGISSTFPQPKLLWKVWTKAASEMKHKLIVTMHLWVVNIRGFNHCCKNIWLGKTKLCYVFYNAQNVLIHICEENLHAKCHPMSAVCRVWCSWHVRDSYKCEKKKRKSKRAGSEANTTSYPYKLPRAPKTHLIIRAANSSGQWCGA